MSEEIRKCTWCGKLLDMVYCDYWDNESKDYKLKLCEECHSKRFDFQHLKANLILQLTKFLGELKND